jgi:Transposase-associated domain
MLLFFRWMYGVRRDIFQYLRGIEEFLNRAIENMRQRVIRPFIVHVVIVRMYADFKISKKIRNYLIRRKFKEQYTRWVWHGESNDERSINVGTSIGFVVDLEDISYDESSG